MNYIVADFETHYADDYGLNLMSTEAYIRDARFEPHLLSISINGSPVEVFEAPDLEYVVRHLPTDRPDFWTVCHNAKFDGSIFTMHYKKRVANPLCTRGMARWTGPSRLGPESLKILSKFFGIQDKGEFLGNVKNRRWFELTRQEIEGYKHYGRIDVENTDMIFRMMLPFCTWECLEFIAMTTRMYINPVLRFDVLLLQRYHQMLTEKFVNSREELAHLFKYPSPEEFLSALRSRSAFPDMLRKLGVDPPMKLSEKSTATAKRKAREKGVPEHEVETIQVWNYCTAKTDPEIIDLGNSDDEDVALLIRVKLEANSSIAMSRCATFLDIAGRGDGSLPVPLEPYNAWTSRFTASNATEGAQSDKSNVQNLAKRTGDKTLRKGIIAPNGFKLLASDSSQIEARFGAWWSCQDDLVYAFAHDEDPYSQLGGRLFDCDPAWIYYYTKGAGVLETGPQAEWAQKTAFHFRDVGKRCILGLQYGMGGIGFGRQLIQQKCRLSDDMEEHYMLTDKFAKIYRNTYPLIVDNWGNCTRVLSSLFAGAAGWFGGPGGNLFYYDGNHQVFGRRCPGIMFPNGYWMLYPNLRWEASKVKKNRKGQPMMTWVFDQQVPKKKGIQRTEIYGSMLYAHLTQGCSAAALQWQALQIDRQLVAVGLGLAMNCHDEWLSLIYDTPEWIAWGIAVYNHWMRTAPDWCQGVPFDCETKVGVCYGEI